MKRKEITMGKKTRYMEYAKGIQAVLDGSSEIADARVEKSILAKLKKLKNKKNSKRVKM